MSDTTGNNNNNSKPPLPESKIPLPPSARTPGRTTTTTTTTPNNNNTKVKNKSNGSTTLIGSNSVNSDSSNISNINTSLPPPLSLTSSSTSASATTIKTNVVSGIPTSSNTQKKINSVTQLSTISAAATTESSNTTTTTTTTTKRRATISGGSIPKSSSPTIAQILASNPSNTTTPTNNSNSATTTPNLIINSSSTSSTQQTKNINSLYSSLQPTASLPSPLSLSLNSNLTTTTTSNNNNTNNLSLSSSSIPQYKSNSNNTTPSHSPSPPPPDEAYLYPQHKTPTSTAQSSAYLLSRSRSPSPLKFFNHHFNTGHNINTTLSDKQLQDTVHNQSNEFVKVYCRFRALSEQEESLLEQQPQNQQQVSKITVTDENHTVKINNGSVTQSFRFVDVLTPNASQQRVFETIALPLMDDVIRGFNVAIIAYGSTGSGKTYTMQGYLYSDFQQQSTTNESSNNDLDNDQLWGIVPRTLRELLTRARQDSSKFKTTIKVSLIEVLQERVHDILANGKDLELRLSDQGFLALDATTITLESPDNITHLLKVANHGPRGRGHLIFSTTVVREDIESKECVTSLLYMVDLSGSEIYDTNSVNRSLYALGGVIEDIAKRAKHVRYRDSKLTQLLQNCLGGNSKTCLIVNCSSCEHDQVLRETLSSLSFGERTQSVRNQAFMNHELTKDQLKLVVQQMRQEMTLLKSFIDNSAGQPGISNQLLKMQLTLEEAKRTESKLQDEITKLESKEREALRELGEAKHQVKSRTTDIERVDKECKTLHQQLNEMRGAKSLELERLSQNVDEWKIKYGASQELLSNNGEYIKTLENQKLKWKSKHDELEKEYRALKNQQQQNQQQQQSPPTQQQQQQQTTSIDNKLKIKCEQLEQQLAHYKQIEANLQAEIAQLKEQQKQQLETLSTLTLHIDSLRQRVEVEFPAIAHIVNTQSSMNSTLESINNNFTKSTTTTTNNNNNNTTNNETGEIMNTVKRIEDIFEKLTEQQQEQSTNIQSFISNFDQTTTTTTTTINSNNFSTTLMNELDERQLEQYNLLFNNKVKNNKKNNQDNNNNNNIVEDNNEENQIPEQQQQQQSNIIIKKESLFSLFCKNFIILIFVMFLVFILMVCVGKTLQTRDIYKYTYKS